MSYIWRGKRVRVCIIIIVMVLLSPAVVIILYSHTANGRERMFIGAVNLVTRSLLVRTISRQLQTKRLASGGTDVNFPFRKIYNNTITRCNVSGTVLGCNSAGGNNALPLPYNCSTFSGMLKDKVLVISNIYPPQ